MDFDKTRIKSTCLWTQTVRKRINAHTFINCIYNAKTANSISHLPQETKALQMTVLISVPAPRPHLLNMVSALCTHPAQLPRGCNYVTHLHTAALKASGLFSSSAGRDCFTFIASEKVRGKAQQA